MTEEEAKMTWCPFVRGADDGANVSLADRIPSWSLCIGSQCMAWRATYDEIAPQHPDDRSRPIYKPAGYCGLAGKP